MTLTFKHFDTRLNQWLHSDGNTANPDSLIKEELDNTLLEFFLPDKQFSFGQMDDYSTASDLKNHPDGHTLLLSSKSRLLYGPEECLEVIEKLCPDRKDRGAYGSIFLGGCNNAINEKLNILVVDDKNGENGGIINNEQAWKLTGDCYGQIDPKLYDLLTNRKLDSTEPYNVIQHRLGWREGDGEDSTFRFGKGTLRPHKLDNLDYIDSNNKPQIDLIIPLSSFKGTDKDNPNGAVKPQIKPGLYNQNIWLGEKSQSQQGKTAISQLLPSFPQGMKDFADELEKQAQDLAEIQKDPRLVAQLYCEKYEQRQSVASKDKDNDEIDQEPGEIDSDNLEEKQEDTAIYKIIKADVISGHYQLLETEKIKQELARFVKKEWREIAIGRTITFDRGLIIPSKELKNGEICVPWIDPDEKVLNFRSPFLNSNGLCVSFNKVVDDCMGPNGKALEGVIVVNDEDHARIQARLDALEEQGIETSETNPAETESQRQARDFDGDCIGVEVASRYPNLTAEAEFRNLPGNAYAPTVKLAKQSFYKEDGSQKEFEEIAIFMSDSKSVGIINNQVTAFEAVESEIDVLKTYGTQEQRSEYVDQVAERYKNLFKQETYAKNPKPIREEYREQMAEFVNLAAVKTRTPEIIDQALTINRSIYRNLIEEGCSQNQIAVDMLKSAHQPDMDLISENRRYLPRKVNYITDKKLDTAYLNKPINPTGSSPVELFISQTNKYFESSLLESRPIIQFSALFKDVEFTEKQKLTATIAKNEFDLKFNEASRLDQRRKIETGPYVIIDSALGKIEVTNLTRYSHPEIWQAKSLNIKLEEIPEAERTSSNPHKLLALAQINSEPEYYPLGTVSHESIDTLQLKANTHISNASLRELKPELQESQVKIIFNEAAAIAKNFYASISEGDRLSAAAAAWNISTTRESNESGQPLKTSSFVFTTFTDEIVSRQSNLQLTDLKLTGIGKDTDNFISKEWNPDQKYSIAIESSDYPEGHPNHNTRLIFVEDTDGNKKEFASLEARTARLPIGTTASANIIPAESKTITATVAINGKPPIEFTIREVSKFDCSNQVFKDEYASLTIGNAAVPDSSIRIKLDGKILGELDAGSIKQLRAINYLNNGAPLKLKLTSFANESKGAFVIGESPNGNLLRINQLNTYDFKDKVFADTQFKVVSLDIPQAKRKDAVFLDGKLLGVLFFDKDKKALNQLGLLQPGKLIKSEYKLNSNFTTASAIVDPSSVQYPQVWTKERNIQVETPSASQNINVQNETITAKIKERPSLLFTTSEDKVLGLVNLAVDEHKIGVVSNWLKSHSIDFNQVSQLDATLEAKKGLAVYSLVAETIQSQDLEALNKKFGGTLDVEAYNETLKSIPNRPQNTTINSEQTNKSAVSNSLISNSDHLDIVPENITNELDKTNNVSNELFPSPAIASQTLTKTEVISPSAHSSNSPEPSFVREQWEKNLLGSAFKAINDNSNNLSDNVRTATFGTSHSITYNTLEGKLAITNNSSNQVIYQAVKGQPASINNLSEQQKEYFRKQSAEENQWIKSKQEIEV